MRKDGKFLGSDGSIPEGQGIVMAHLNECHELLEMVRFFLAHVRLLFLIYLFQLKETMEDRGDDEDEYTDGGDAASASRGDAEVSDSEGYDVEDTG
jgi:hypothetical protein